MRLHFQPSTINLEKQTPDNFYCQEYDFWHDILFILPAGATEQTSISSRRRSIDADALFLTEARQKVGVNQRAKVNRCR